MANQEEYLTLGKQKVKITHSDKIYWPDDHITKGELITYYQSVYPHIIPYLKNRPQSLKRTPNGIGNPGFYQKDAGDHIPKWIKTKAMFSESTDAMIDYIICNAAATLAYLNNLGCIELNPWHSTISKPDKPDYMIIDIDPSDTNTFDQVIEAAQAVKTILEKADVTGYCKTSGATGLHIYLPLQAKYDYEQVKTFAQLIAHLSQELLPNTTTLERSLSKRGPKIYMDYLQNRKGQTIASVYSLRPKKGAPVSMPLEWKEVKKGLEPIQFNIKNSLKRIEKNGDLFAPILGKGIDLNKCMEALEKNA